MQRPLFNPVPTVLSTLLFITTITVAVFISLLLLFYYCYFYKTVTTDKLLRARLLSGAAELTTHLLRLIIILWLPLCRINKLGFTSLEDCGDPIYLWVISRQLKPCSHGRSFSWTTSSTICFLCFPSMDVQKVEIYQN